MRAITQTAIVLLVVTSFITMQTNAQTSNEVKLFVSGTDGYDTYRIPALVSTMQGTVLAFAEGRKSGGGDSGNIDMIVKRSEDNGTTWSAQQVVWDDGDNVCGNPCPVIDRTTGEIFLLMTWNLGSDHESQIIKQTSKDTRRIYIASSKDDGKTWSPPKEITANVKLPNWTWYATGPCSGIQLKHGKNKGRLIIPCDHIEAETNKYFSHIIYSDDHGKTWKLGGSTPTDQVNECQAVELPDGKLMLNMRNYNRSKKARAISVSKDSGQTWGEVYHDEKLIEPICQASLINFTHDSKPCLVFSNPASTSARVNMTVRLSLDNGKTWPASKTIHEGPSAYSSLTVLPDKSIGLLYEHGEKHPYETITFTRIEPDCLTGSN